MFVYLDNSATTRPYDQVTEVVRESMDQLYGNPSSLHGLGLAAEKKIRESRKIAADALGAAEAEVFFTSGGTESDNTALFGIAHAKRREGKKIITTKVEHPAILETCKALEAEGFIVEYVDVDDRCRLNLSQLASLIDDQTILISVMAVNNETGAVMPLKEISSLCEKALLHTDAVQGLGKIDLRNTGADLISVSGHKIHGPKGIGALYVKKGVRLPAMILGGGQEFHQRSGTENVPGILGFGTACRMACSDIPGKMKRMSAVRNYLLSGLTDQISDIRVNSPSDGSPAVLNLSFLGTRGDVLLHTLEQDQIYVSTGSACSSNKKGQSHVLKAMGLAPEEIEGAVRFSFSQFNTIEEMDYVIDKTKNAVNRFRRLGSFR